MKERELKILQLESDIKLKEMKLAIIELQNQSKLTDYSDTVRTLQDHIIKVGISPSHLVDTKGEK